MSTCDVEFNEKVNDQQKALNRFLKDWDENYKSSVRDIKLFDRRQTGLWSDNQKAYFAKVFYHSRGYFRDFLWHLGNFAPTKKIKDIILENIEEEFNGDDFSHEQYYIDFASKVGADLEGEILRKENYTKEMREFNESHLVWLNENSWETGFAGFAAYERLDCIDYELISGIVEPEHKFFAIHRQADHFSKTYYVLMDIWEENPILVENAFDFIGKTQKKMWEDLSNSVFKLK